MHVLDSIKIFTPDNYHQTILQYRVFMHEFEHALQAQEEKAQRAQSFFERHGWQRKNSIEIRE